MELNQRKLLSLKSWKVLAEKGEAPKDAVVLVSVDIAEAKQLDEDGNVYRFVISSQNPDRDKDVIEVDGWHFENYNKNPVVLFGHNYRSLPVAAGSPPTVESDKVLSNADFSATKSDHLYSEITNLPNVQSALRGLNAGVVGLLLVTAYRLGRSTIKDYFGMVLAVVALVLALVANVPLVGIVVGSGVLGIVTYFIERRSSK